MTTVIQVPVDASLTLRIQQECDVRWPNHLLQAAFPLDDVVVLVFQPVTDPVPHSSKKIHPS